MRIESETLRRKLRRSNERLIFWKIWCVQQRLTTRARSRMESFINEGLKSLKRLWIWEERCLKLVYRSNLEKQRLKKHWILRRRLNDPLSIRTHLITLMILRRQQLRCEMQPEFRDFLISDLCPYLKYQKQKHKISEIQQLQVILLIQNERRDMKPSMTHKSINI